jgi:hypothetical protein
MVVRLLFAVAEETLMRRIVGTIVMSAFLMSPAFLMADDHDKRYYDKEHKDYHHWDAREDKAYHVYWEQNHHPYRDWGKINDHDRADYWRWRHEHSDSVLQINIP